MARHTYRLHKARNLAVVTLGGKTHYLGKYGSDESKAEYRRLVAEFKAAGGNLVEPGPDGLSVNEILLAYVRQHQNYYRKNGKPTSEATLIRLALRPVKELYGHRPATEFGPRALCACRHEMIEAGLALKTINSQGDRIRRVFRWAVMQQLAASSVYEAPRAVPRLRKGRSAARETEPVRPAPEHAIEAVLEFVPRQVAAMIRLQYLTGMRPGEVVGMKGRDLDRQGSVWIYTPESHKTEHLGKARTVPIGPKAQEVIRGFLRADPGVCLFSPRDAERDRNARKKAARNSPMTPSQAKRRPKKRPKRRAGKQYTVASYRRCIARACDRAEVERWHPHQLRHNAATRIRREHGLEAARAVLGHSSVVVTEIYAELDQSRAIEVMADVG